MIHGLIGGMLQQELDMVDIEGTSRVNAVTMGGMWRLRQCQHEQGTIRDKLCRQGGMR